MGCKGGGGLLGSSFSKVFLKYLDNFAMLIIFAYIRMFFCRKKKKGKFGRLENFEGVDCVSS